MSEQSWTVVRFIDENTVEAVPSSWIIQDRCYWPPFKNEKIMAIIRKNELPNTCWPSYKISIFRNSTFDDYKTAREKCKKSECTSDLNSEADDVRRKKKRSNKWPLSSSEDEDNRILPTPPLLKLVTDAQNKNKNKYCLAFSASKSDDESAEDTSCIQATPKMSNTGLPKTKEFYSGSFSALHDQNDKPSNDLDNNSICTCKRCPIHKNLQNNNDSVTYFKEIIRQQHLFKAEIWQQSDNIRVIINTLENLHPDINGNNIVGNRKQSIFYSCDIPIQNERQLEEQVENFLQIDTNFDTSVLEASKVGGKSAYEFVKRTLSQILTNELAAKYSWLGKKKKRVFRTLKLSQLLLAAGEKVNATFTKKDIEEAIQKWLKRAKERCDAEQKRLNVRRQPENL